MIRLVLISISLLISTARAQREWTSADLDIYTAALHFFDPPRNQVRWIELDPIPADMRDSLIHRLGDHFEGWSAGHEKDPRSGGRVHLSTINRIAADSVSVSAQYQHRGEYYTNRPVDVRLTIVKRNTKWVLLKN